MKFMKYQSGGRRGPIKTVINRQFKLQLRSADTNFVCSLGTLNGEAERSAANVTSEDAPRCCYDKVSKRSKKTKSSPDAAGTPSPTNVGERVRSRPGIPDRTGMSRGNIDSIKTREPNKPLTYYL